MPAFNDPAQRSGAAKSKEEAEGQQACAATRNSAGRTAGEAQATEHGRCIADRAGMATERGGAGSSVSGARELPSRALARHHARIHEARLGGRMLAGEETVALRLRLDPEQRRLIARRVERVATSR